MSLWAGLIMLAARPAVADWNPQVDAAVKAVHAGTATKAQNAIVFANIKDINLMRLQGRIPDNVYQAAQAQAKIDQFNLARDAGKSVGVDVEYQGIPPTAANDPSKATSPADYKKREQAYRQQVENTLRGQAANNEFKPGTDTDLDAKGVDSPKKAAQLDKAFNKRAGEFAKQGNPAVTGNENWGKIIDTDILAPTSGMSEKEFKQANKGKEAYTKKGSVSTQNKLTNNQTPGAKIEKHNVSDIADFFDDSEKLSKDYEKNKKQLNADPATAGDDLKSGDLTKSKAKEVKYIDRMNETTKQLSKQHGIQAPEQSTLAKEGSDRNTIAQINENKLNNTRTTADIKAESRFELASTQSDNLRNQAKKDMATVVSEVGGKTPGSKADKIDAIIRTGEGLSMQDQSDILEKVRQDMGPDAAKKVREGFIDSNKKIAASKVSGNPSTSSSSTSSSSAISKSAPPTGTTPGSTATGSPNTTGAVTPAQGTSAAETAAGTDGAAKANHGTSPELHPDGSHTKLDPAKTPELKVDAPDVPAKPSTGKTSIAAAPVAAAGTIDTAKIKAKAGQVMDVGGKGMDIIDIGATAKDVQDHLTKGEYKEAGQLLAEAGADVVTGGAYGTTKMVTAKVGDKLDADKNNSEAYQKEMRGYKMDIINTLRKANVKDSEIFELLQSTNASDFNKVDQKFKELNVKSPKRPDKKDYITKGDDTVMERAGDVADGLYSNAVKAKQFYKDTGSNTLEIASGLTEKGVVKEIAHNVKDQSKAAIDMLRDWWNDPDIKTAGNQAMKEKFQAQGMSEVLAGRLADAYTTENKKEYSALLSQWEDKKATVAAEKKQKEEQEKIDQLIIDTLFTTATPENTKPSQADPAAVAAFAKEWENTLNDVLDGKPIPLIGGYEISLTSQGGLASFIQMVTDPEHFDWLVKELAIDKLVSDGVSIETIHDNALEAYKETIDQASNEAAKMLDTAKSMASMPEDTFLKSAVAAVNTGVGLGGQIHAQRKEEKRAEREKQEREAEEARRQEEQARQQAESRRRHKKEEAARAAKSAENSSPDAVDDSPAPAPAPSGDHSGPCSPLCSHNYRPPIISGGSGNGHFSITRIP